MFFKFVSEHPNLKCTLKFNCLESFELLVLSSKYRQVYSSVISGGAGALSDNSYAVSGEMSEDSGAIVILGVDLPIVFICLKCSTINSGGDSDIIGRQIIDLPIVFFGRNKKQN